MSHLPDLEYNKNFSHKRDSITFMCLQHHHKFIKKIRIYCYSIICVLRLQTVLRKDGRMDGASSIHRTLRQSQGPKIFIYWSMKVQNLRDQNWKDVKLLVGRGKLP